MVRDRLLPWLLVVVLVAAILLGGLLLAQDARPDFIPGVIPAGIRDPEAALLDRHAEIGSEIAVLLDRVQTDLDEIDRLHAERATINYRLRRLRDTGDPVLDLGAGP